jgi:ferredoxin
MESHADRTTGKKQALPTGCLPSQQLVAATRADRDRRKIGLRVRPRRWFGMLGRVENLCVRRGGRRCLCGACEPVCQHGAEGRHENRGLLPRARASDFDFALALPVSNGRQLRHRWEEVDHGNRA